MTSDDSKTRQRQFRQILGHASSKRERIAALEALLKPYLEGDLNADEMAEALSKRFNATNESMEINNGG